ncbi:transcription initiation factor TFIID subunit 3, partial [Borealophlyctis nickersoniae]
MSSSFASGLSRIAVAQLLCHVGFDTAQGSACNVLADLMSRYLELLAMRAKDYAEIQGRTASNLDDVARCLEEEDVDVEVLKEFGKKWAQITGT